MKQALTSLLSATPNYVLALVFLGGPMVYALSLALAKLKEIQGN
jgi:hypothetical protein